MDSEFLAAIRDMAMKRKAKTDPSVPPSAATEEKQALVPPAPPLQVVTPPPITEAPPPPAPPLPVPAAPPPAPSLANAEAAPASKTAVRRVAAPAPTGMAAVFAELQRKRRQLSSSSPLPAIQEDKEQKNDVFTTPVRQTHRRSATGSRFSQPRSTPTSPYRLTPANSEHEAEESEKKAFYDHQEYYLKLDKIPTVMRAGVERVRVEMRGILANSNMPNGLPLQFLENARKRWVEAAAAIKNDSERQAAVNKYNEEAFNFLYNNYLEGEYEPAETLQREKGAKDASLTIKNAFADEIKDKETKETLAIVKEKIEEYTKILQTSRDKIAAEAQLVVGFALHCAVGKYNCGIKKLNNTRLPHQYKQEESKEAAFTRPGYTYELPHAALQLDIVLTHLEKTKQLSEAKEMLLPILQEVVTNPLFLPNGNELFVVNSPLIGQNIRGRSDAIAYGNVNISAMQAITHFWPELDKHFSLLQLKQNLHNALQTIFPQLPEHEKIIENICKKYKPQFIERENTKLSASNANLDRENDCLEKLEKLKKRADRLERGEPLDDDLPLEQAELIEVKKYASRKAGLEGNIAASNQEIEDKKALIKQLSDADELPELKFAELIAAKYYGEKEIDIAPKITEDLAKTTFLCIQQLALEKYKEQVKLLPCIDILTKSEELRTARAAMDKQLKEADEAVKQLLTNVIEKYNEAMGLKPRMVAELKKEALQKQRQTGDTPAKPAKATFLTKEVLDVFKGILNDIDPANNNYPQLLSKKYETERLQIESYIECALQEVGITYGDGQRTIAQLAEQLQKKDIQLQQKDVFIQQLNSAMEKYKSDHPDEKQISELLQLVMQRITADATEKAQLRQTIEELNEDMENTLANVRDLCDPQVEPSVKDAIIQDFRQYFAELDQASKSGEKPPRSPVKHRESSGGANDAASPPTTPFPHRLAAASPRGK